MLLSATKTPMRVQGGGSRAPFLRTPSPFRTMNPSSSSSVGAARKFRTIRGPPLLASSYSGADSSSGGSRKAAPSPKIALDELRALEKERDEAIAIAESCARSAVKLTDVVRLLGELAERQVGEGEEEAARKTLIEKASAKEAQEKTSSKALANFALASKLANKIGAMTGRAPPPPPPPSAPQTRFRERQDEAPPSPSYSDSTSDSSYSSYTFQKPKWQESLEEAKERMKDVEGAAGRVGAAARVSAESSIAAAQERLRRQGFMSSEEKIRDGQKRLREQDEQVMTHVKRILSRYRQGDRVTEEELEFAFQMLERRTD